MALVKYNNNSISDVTALAGVPAGDMTLIKTLTASSSGTLSFVDGSSDVVLDNTYPIYLFKFINIHPASASHLSVGFRDGGTDYDATKTTTYFRSYHRENGAESGLGYNGNDDLAQSTAFARLNENPQLGTDNDHSLCGEMYFFNPSSTTYVKHFFSRAVSIADYILDNYAAGYVNTTTAIDGVQFKMASGNIDSGTIKLYGIKDS